MRTTAILPLIALVLTGCGSMLPSTQVRDDVYDIPERAPIYTGSTGETAPVNGLPEGFVEDYFDPNDSGNYDLGYYTDEASYQDITYNDPAWYNQGRFGFGVGVSSWGPSYGIGMSYGYPGIYNPYMSFSYMSGYGAWGYPYGGYYPYGYYPYGGYCPSCYGCYGVYPTATIAHRPSLSGGGSRPGGPSVPTRYQANTLSRPRPAALDGARDVTRVVTGKDRSSKVDLQNRSTRTGSPQRVKGSEGSMQRGGSRTGGGGSRPATGGSRSGGGGGSRPSTGGGRR